MPWSWSEAEIAKLKTENDALRVAGAAAGAAAPPTEGGGLKLQGGDEGKRQLSQIWTADASARQALRKPPDGGGAPGEAGGAAAAVALAPIEESRARRLLILYD